MTEEREAWEQLEADTDPQDVVDYDPHAAPDGWLSAGMLRLSHASLLAVGLMTTATWGARLHWVFELFTHFCVQLLVVAIVATLAAFQLKSRRWGWAGVIICLVLAGRLFPQRQAPAASGAEQLRVVLANVQAGALGYAPLLEFINQHQPDMLVIVELSPQSHEQLAPLLRDFPHQHQAVQRDAFGIGIYSKLPTSGAQQLFFDGMSPSLIARAHLASGRTMQVIATHPVPPMSRRLSLRRNECLAALTDEAASVAEPLVVLGDLNCTPWSPYFKRLLRDGKLLDTGSAFQSSWPAQLPWPLRIPIDHVLVNQHWNVVERQLGPPYASDHLPVLVKLQLR